MHGITLYSNPGNTITNNGTITVTCSGGLCGAITGSRNTINTGTITVNRTGASGLAAYALDVSGPVTNSGRIEVNGGSGISLKLPDGTLSNKNGGFISATGTAVSIVAGTVINEQGAAITSSGATGLVLGDSILKNATSLTNDGAISGITGVHAPGGNATIDNYGSITGTGAPPFSSTATTIRLCLHDLPTVVVAGAIVATGNSNTLELDVLQGPLSLHVSFQDFECFFSMFPSSTYISMGLLTYVCCHDVLYRIKTENDVPCKRSGFSIYMFIRVVVVIPKRFVTSTVTESDLPSQSLPSAKRSWSFYGGLPPFLPLALAA